MVISTITDFEASTLIVGQVRKVNQKAVLIAKSDDIDEASILYEKGASYVMMPHYLGGTRTISLIGKHGFDLSEFTKERRVIYSILTRRWLLNRCNYCGRLFCCKP
ncbi:MAG: hypothetical protein BWY68_00391 [bacterium ADurb.Bin400]|nr:MAG: hypothetical protein BWY68_00391 [bacterium ADurb.Bin400]